MTFKLESPTPHGRVRSLPKGWHRVWVLDHWEAERVADLPDGTMLAANAEPPCGSSDPRGGTWEVEHFTITRTARKGATKTQIGAWEGTYRGSLADGARAAEVAIAEHVPGARVA